MDYKSIIYAHIGHGFESFASLDKDKKRELVCYALLSDDFDGYDLLMIEDESKGKLSKENFITHLIFNNYVKHRITVFDVVERALDNIIAHKADYFEEKFEEELEARAERERAELNFPVPFFKSFDEMYHSPMHYYK